MPEQLQTHSAAATAAGEAYSAWQSARGGAVNELDAQIIAGLVDEFTAKWVTAAIHEANAARQDRLPSITFVEAILRRWKREGFKQPFDPQANRERTEAERQKQEESQRLRRKLKEWNLQHGIVSADTS